MVKLLRPRGIYLDGYLSFKFPPHACSISSLAASRYFMFSRSNCILPNHVSAQSEDHFRSIFLHMEASYTRYQVHIPRKTEMRSVAHPLIKVWNARRVNTSPLLVYQLALSFYEGRNIAFSYTTQRHFLFYLVMSHYSSDWG